jgi:hypothetical protein
MGPAVDYDVHSRIYNTTRITRFIVFASSLYVPKCCNDMCANRMGTANRLERGHITQLLQKFICSYQSSRTCWTRVRRPHIYSKTHTQTCKNHSPSRVWGFVFTITHAYSLWVYNPHVDSLCYIASIFKPITRFYNFLLSDELVSAEKLQF